MGTQTKRSKATWPWPLTFNKLVEVVAHFTQNFIKLSAAVQELSCKQRKNLATMLKTILSPLAPAVKSRWDENERVKQRVDCRPAVYDGGLDDSRATLSHFTDKVQEVRAVIRHAVVRPRHVLHLTYLPLIIWILINNTQWLVCTTVSPWISYSHNFVKY